MLYYCKFSRLKDAFKERMRAFISKSRERQRLVALKSEERRYQSHLEAEQQRTLYDETEHPPRRDEESALGACVGPLVCSRPRDSRRCALVASSPPTAACAARTGVLGAPRGYCFIAR